MAAATQRCRLGVLRAGQQDRGRPGQLAEDGDCAGQGVLRVCSPCPSVLQTCGSSAGRLRDDLGKRTIASLAITSRLRLPFRDKVSAPPLFLAPALCERLSPSL